MSTYFSKYQRMCDIFYIGFGWKLCLTYGTFLGYIRKGGSIGFDHDYDVTYLSKKRDIIVSTEYKKIANRLNQLVENFIEVDGFQFIWMSKCGGGYLDVFTSWLDRKGNFNLYFAISEKMDESVIFSLRCCKFGGVTVFCSNMPEILLQHLYGSQWRIHDPNFNWGDLLPTPQNQG